MVEGALKRLARAATAGAAPAPTAAAAAALRLVLVLGRLILDLLLGLGVERGRHERVVLCAQVRLLLDARSERVARRLLELLRGHQLVLALEGVDVAHAHLELMRDPGVRSALMNPSTDLVQLRLERPAGHRAREG